MGQYCPSAWVRVVFYLKWMYRIQDSTVHWLQAVHLQRCSNYTVEFKQSSSFKICNIIHYFSFALLSCSSFGFHISLAKWFCKTTYSFVTIPTNIYSGNPIECVMRTAINICSVTTLPCGCTIKRLRITLRASLSPLLLPSLIWPDSSSIREIAHSSFAIEWL